MHVYPAAIRATRDLLPRRLQLVRKRGQLLAHIQNTRAQYNPPAFARSTTGNSSSRWPRLPVSDSLAIVARSSTSAPAGGGHDEARVTKYLGAHPPHLSADHLPTTVTTIRAPPVAMFDNHR
jgi:hypothetical protein